MEDVQPASQNVVVAAGGGELLRQADEADVKLSKQIKEKDEQLVSDDRVAAVAMEVVDNSETSVGGGKKQQENEKESRQEKQAADNSVNEASKVVDSKSTSKAAASAPPMKAMKAAAAMKVAPPMKQAKAAAAPPMKVMKSAPPAARGNKAASSKAATAASSKETSNHVVDAVEEDAADADVEMKPVSEDEDEMKITEQQEAPKKNGASKVSGKKNIKASAEQVVPAAGGKKSSSSSSSSSASSSSSSATTAAAAAASTTTATASAGAVDPANPHLKVKIGHVSQNEDTEMAKNQPREDATAFAKLDPTEKFLDALKREHWKDVCETFAALPAETQWKVLLQETQKMTFPCSPNRNNIYLNTAKEDELGVGVTGGVDKRKTRPFFNLGLQACRPLGKCSKAMREADGRKLSLLVNVMMKCGKDRAPMTVTAREDWWYSSCTVNRGGITNIHVDDGNLGPSRLFAWGKGFVGGQTLRMAEASEVDALGVDGVEWYPCPREARLVPKSLQERARDFGNGKTELKPFKFMRMSDRKILICDKNFVDESADTEATLLDIALPMVRLTSLHRLGDFDGKLPHATAPVFPASWRDHPEERPASIRDCKNLEWASSPEEAKNLMDAANAWAGGQGAAKSGTDIVRYVCVFYPHGCAVPSKCIERSCDVVASLGFEKLREPWSLEARKNFDQYKERVNVHGNKGVTVKVGGKDVVYMGGKAHLRSDKMKDEENEIQEKVQQKLGKSYVVPKNFVSNHAAFEENPWYMYDNIFREEGFADSVRKMQLLNGNVTQMDHNAPGAHDGEQNENEDDDGEINSENSEEDAAPADGTTGNGAGAKKKTKKVRTAKSETEQARRMMRAPFRAVEGRVLSWFNGEKPTGSGDLGLFCYRDHPPNWWWIRPPHAEARNVQPVLDLMELAFGRIDKDHYKQLREDQNLTRDEALKIVKWAKTPLKVGISTKKLELSVRATVDKNGDPLEKAVLDKDGEPVLHPLTGKPKMKQTGGTWRILLSARTEGEFARPQLHKKGHWGKWEKDRNADFVREDTLSEIELEEQLKEHKKELKKKKDDAGAGDTATAKGKKEPMKKSGIKLVGKKAKGDKVAGDAGEQGNADTTGAEGGPAAAGKKMVAKRPRGRPRGSKKAGLEDLSLQNDEAEAEVEMQSSPENKKSKKQGALASSSSSSSAVQKKDPFQAVKKANN
ncbi:unnamed protein product [Amoebophrya sp. A120]|nr:unnamed protein product [Amoebophrya sp. A120]|eukprot:GSA120T00024647001.1